MIKNYSNQKSCSQNTGKHMAAGNEPSTSYHLSYKLISSHEMPYV